MLIAMNGTATPLFFPDLFLIMLIEVLTILVEYFIIWLGYARNIEEKAERFVLLELVIIGNLATWMIGIVVFFMFANPW